MTSADIRPGGFSKIYGLLLTLPPVSILNAGPDLRDRINVDLDPKHFTVSIFYGDLLLTGCWGIILKDILTRYLDYISDSGKLKQYFLEDCL
jgi:hypothetical protein